MVISLQHKFMIVYGLSMNEYCMEYALETLPLKDTLLNNTKFAREEGTLSSVEYFVER